VTMEAGVLDTSLDVVELDVPAHPAYVAVVRTAAAGLAARADLTLDRIEDLRIAVDEACALLLHRREGDDPYGTVSDASADDPADDPTDDPADPADDPAQDVTIHCLFTVEEDALTVDISGPQVTLPDPSAFAWAVLDALVDSLRTGEDLDHPDGPATWLRLSVRSGAGSWT
jgi:serine/threonine-protein kinase RsbW